MAFRSQAASASLFRRFLPSALPHWPLRHASAMKLRHAPLLLVREMARLTTHRALVADTLARVIQRADELSEFVAIYWANGRQPLSGQVKKGLAAAFVKFDEYALAKYDRAGAVRLRDVLFLSHARPVDESQAALWKRLAANELATPDTWEVALSATGREEGVGDKRQVWERLLARAKAWCAGSLAQPSQHARCRRRRRTMSSLRSRPSKRIAFCRSAFWQQRASLRSGSRPLRLPCSAHSRAAPLALPGHTVLLVDVSGSMEVTLSHRSEMRRTDAAYGLAILLREIAEKVTIYTFSNDARSRAVASGNVSARCPRQVAASRRDHLGEALGQVETDCREGYDRTRGHHR